MTTDANKALVRRFVKEVFEQGRTDAVDELVAPDFVRRPGVRLRESGRAKAAASAIGLC